MAITRPVSSAVASPMPEVDAFNPPPGSGLTPVVGDNTTDDRAALQAALDYVKATHGGGRVVMSKPNCAGVRITSGITIPSRVQLASDEETFLFAVGLDPGEAAITVNDQDFTPLVGIRMDGANFVPASTPTDSTIGISVTGVNLNFEKLAMQYFGKHLALAHNSTFLLMFSDCRLGRAGTIVDLDIEGAGVGNAGERVVFRGCVLANSNRAFHATANGAHLRFEDCSIDFCTEFGRINNAQVVFRGHLECSSSTPHLFDVTGNSRLHISDTVMVLGKTLITKEVGPANYGFGSVRISNSSCFWTAPDDVSRNRMSEDLVPWETGVTTKTLRYPWPLKWLPVTAQFCGTDGATVPNDDTLRITAMDIPNQTITLTSTASYAGQRWSVVRFS